MSEAAASKPTGAQEHPKAEILARGLHGDVGIGLIGLGGEADYMVTPHLGFGFQVTAFGVDNGEYPWLGGHQGLLASGWHWLAFAEADLLRAFITPYLRLGVGVGSYERYFGEERRDVANGVVQLSAGVAFRLGPILLRTAASPSLFGKDTLIEYSVGLGFTGLERFVSPRR